MTAVMTVAARNRARLHRPDLRVEKDLLRTGYTRLAAMDEVGRGALAGPVTIGVVVVTASIGRVPPGLRDSKLLTPAAREQLVKPVRRWALEWAVGHASAAEIDAFGIMTALRMAGRRAIAALPAPVDAVLLDGNHDYLNTPAQAALFGDPSTGADWPGLPVHLRIKADLRCAGVAAASVLAKTERDRLMTSFATDYPAYGWGINKGYATPEHLAAIASCGPCEEHRRSWRLTGPPVGEDGAEDDGEWTDEEFAAAECGIAAGIAEPECGMDVGDETEDASA
jgi:ribonuclease HII